MVAELVFLYIIEAFVIKHSGDKVRGFSTSDLRTGESDMLGSLKPATYI